MANVLRFPDLALGELEREVLEILWTEGPQNPGTVDERRGHPPPRRFASIATRSPFTASASATSPKPSRPRSMDGPSLA
jgi:hypothetical protein